MTRARHRHLLPVLLVLLAVTLAPSSGLAGWCTVRQQALAVDPGGSVLVVFQMQTCLAHLPMFSFIAYDTGNGQPLGRHGIWRTFAELGEGDFRLVARFLAGFKAELTPYSVEDPVPGLVVPARDPELRATGAMDCPFLGESGTLSSFSTPPASPDPPCRDVPCPRGAGSCQTAPHPIPGGTVCEVEGVLEGQGAGPTVRYLKLLRGGDRKLVVDGEQDFARWSREVQEQIRLLNSQEATGISVPDLVALSGAGSPVITPRVAGLLQQQGSPEALAALLDLVCAGPAALVREDSLTSLETLYGRIKQSKSAPLLAAKLEALGEEEACVPALLTLVAQTCTESTWRAARRFLSARGIPDEVLEGFLSGCGKSMSQRDGDLLAALVVDDKTGINIRRAAARALKAIPGENARRLTGKLRRQKELPKEVRDGFK